MTENAPSRNFDEGLGRWDLPKVAVVVVLFAVGSFVTLLVVLATRQSDALAATALGLAVVAFLAQWIAFAFQGSQASQQLAEFHKIQVATTDSLSEIRTNARATQTTVNDQLGFLLRDISLKTKETVSEADGEGSEEFRSRILSDVTRIIYESQAGAAQQVGHEHRPTSLAATRHLAFLHDWPTGEGMRRLAGDGLASLSDDAWQVLVRFAKDLEDSLRHGFADGLRDDPRHIGVQELTELHVLYSTSDDDASGRRNFRLDGFKGRASARIVLAEGPMPEIARDLFPWLPEARESAGSR